MLGSLSKNRLPDISNELDEAALSLLPQILTCLGLVYFFLFFFHLIILTGDARRIMAITSGVSAIILIPSGLFIKQKIKSGLAHPVLFIALVIAIFNSVLHAWLLSDPLQTTNLMLLSFACGFMMYRPFWFASGILSICICWTLTAVMADFSDVWIHFGFALVFSFVISALVFWARIGNFLKIRSFEKELVDKNSSLSDEIEMRKKVEEDLIESKKQLIEVNNMLDQRVRERTLELEKAKEMAETLTLSAKSADIAKTRFLANVSHELITPLNAIIGLTSQVFETNGNKCFDNDSLIHIHKSAELLSLHVGKMLDLSKLEADQLYIEQNHFDLIRSVDETISLFKEHAEAKGLIICKKYPEAKELIIKGDDKRLRQILSQLLGNAIKFSDSGNIIIKHIVERNIDESKSSVKIEVCDSGPGLSPEYEKRLTAAFSSVDDSLQRSSVGLGLGLALASRLAGLMGGQLGYYNNPGVGATFWVKFNLVDRNIHQNNQYETIQCKEALCKKKILVVDDNPVNRLLAEKVLKNLGFEPKSAKSGIEALIILGAEEFDAVLMDVQMEGMDGIETTKRIRKNDSGVIRQGIPIIALTAHDTLEDRKACIDVGMDGYVAKPLRPDLLLSAFSKIFHHSSESWI